MLTMRALLFILALLLALLWLAWPSHAQDCFSPEMAVVELDKYTKANNVQAQAWLWQSDHPAVKLMIVWFSNVPQAIVVSAFKDGCLVQMPSGKTSQVLPIDGDIQKAVGAAELIFDNGVKNSPFAAY